MNKTVPVALTLASLLTLSGCAGTTSDFECNATTSDTCMTIEQAKAAHPELQPVAIEMIEESEQPEVADAFDYYYVPTFYVDGVKVHEGGIYPEEVEKILRSALE